jgi:hypothetical protein
MTDGVSSKSLGRLIDEELDLDATTAKGLTNHLPMALVAKAGLGATNDELERFSTKYRQRLVPTSEPSRDLTTASWRTALGESDAYVDLVAYFEREIHEHGIEETLRTHLEHLIDGISGAAFHGVIRLAYALDVASPPRVATGLAYLASSAMALGPLDRGTATSDDPEMLLRELARDSTWRRGQSRRTISEEMRVVAAQPQFAGVATSLEISATSPDRLAKTALGLYASTNDFTALHGVTGLEAISRLRAYVSDLERLDRATFQALAAAYLSIGAPEMWSTGRLDEMRESTTLFDNEVARRAALSDDEHVAKIVFTSRRLNETTREPLYLAVAERAVLYDRSVDDEPTC